jgi:DNA-binding NarL/FixJ family response regulator
MRDGLAGPIRILIFDEETAGRLPAEPADVEIVLLSGETNAVALADALELIAGRIRRRHGLARFDGADGALSARSIEAGSMVRDLLSEGQRRILMLISQGCSNREIAARIHLSENTVKSHIQEIFRKLGVRTRVEAAIRATRDGLL